MITNYPDVIQGTDEWHAQRRGIVTASVVGQLLTPTLKVAANDTSRGLTAVLTAERITGWTDPTYVGEDMLRGHEDEPRAVETYEKHYKVPVTTTGFITRDEGTWVLGYSPDGLVGNDGLLEVKSRRTKKQLQTILADQVPSECMAQLQAGLLASGREWIDYLSYCGGMPMYRKRVFPDPKWFDAIIEAVELFETNSAAMVRSYLHLTRDMPMTERTVEIEMMI